MAGHHFELTGDAPDETNRSQSVECIYCGATETRAAAVQSSSSPTSLAQRLYANRTTATDAVCSRAP